MTGLVSSLEGVYLKKATTARSQKVNSERDTPSLNVASTKFKCEPYSFFYKKERKGEERKGKLSVAAVVSLQYRVRCVVTFVSLQEKKKVKGQVEACVCADSRRDRSSLMYMYIHT